MKLFEEVELDLDITPYQQQFIDSDKTYVGITGGYGIGKSEVLFRKAILHFFIKPNTDILYLAPTLELCEKVLVKKFCSFLLELGIAYTVKVSKKLIEVRIPVLCDGKPTLITCEVHYRSMSEPETIVGVEYGLALIDEIDILSLETAKLVVSNVTARSRENVKDVQICFATTNEGTNYIDYFFIQEPKRLRNKAKIKGREWVPDRVLFRAGTHENPFLDKQYTQNLLNIYGEKLARRYVLGEILQIGGGTVYYNFDNNINVGEVKFSKKLSQNKILWAWDFNRVPMASALCQYVDGQIQMFDELFFHEEVTIDEAVIEFDNLYGDYIKKNNTEIYLFGDATGNTQGNHQTRETNFEVIFLSLERLGFDMDLVKIEVSQSNPRVIERLNCFNVCLGLTKGRSFPLFVVDKGCIEMLSDLRNVKTVGDNPSKLDQKTDKKRTHISDAVGYLLVEFFYDDLFIREDSSGYNTTNILG